MGEKKSGEPEKKSYYEELQEKISETDYTDYQLQPSGNNGFGTTERKVWYGICGLFLAILIAVYTFGVLAWLTRDREVTAENYREYFTVEVSPTKTSNWDSFFVTVKPNQKINYTVYQLSVTVEISFEKYEGKGTIVKQAEFFCEEFTKDSILTQTVEVGEITYFSKGVKVLSVSGET